MTPPLEQLLGDPPLLKEHILQSLAEVNRRRGLFPKGVSRFEGTSSVLFLMGPHCVEGRGRGEACVILNKRSRWVKQPGDLCFPGGRVDSGFDSRTARLLTLPGTPLAGWRYWAEWRRLRPGQARRLALLLAAGLREGVEEMRLNPLWVRFLGPLPPQELVMYDRVIYPMVGWVERQKRFFPNWEVERVVYVPLKALLTPENYGLYRIRFQRREDEEDGAPEIKELPCFILDSGFGREILWGATYRIVAAFLNEVFGFNPPGRGSLPLVHGTLGPDYFLGYEARGRMKGEPGEA
ncbi:MAG: hypothetical protein ACLFUP_02480 [Desulfobacteraceae bacterium]